MLKPLSIYLQYLLPQHFLSYVMGIIGDSRLTWLKNYFIDSFIKRYDIELNDALITDPHAYASFNEFFTRKLKPQNRPISPGEKTIISPVDGKLTQYGKINQSQLLQAKHYYFDLNSLLGGDHELANHFIDGEYATFYLCPKDYHRIHMPIDGKLLKTIFIPGNLFSVNQQTTHYVPNLYSRNERLVSIFETKAGLVAVILIGAMIVGSIQTVWQDKAIKSKKIITENFDTTSIYLPKGGELGLFKMGSSVILLFQNQSLVWSNILQKETSVQYGQILAQC